MYKQLQERGMESPPVNVCTLRDMKRGARADRVPDRLRRELRAARRSRGRRRRARRRYARHGDPGARHDGAGHRRRHDLSQPLRGTRRCAARFLIVDMPFMSYTTARASARQRRAADARGRRDDGEARERSRAGRIVEHLARQDIPICAHLGLKPQSVHKIGGFKVQGREQEAARKIIDDARALERAGADVVLLECVPNAVGDASRDAVQTCP